MDKSEEILQHLDDIKEGVTKTNKLSRSQLKLVNEITRSIEAEEENEFENAVSDVDDTDNFDKKIADYKKIKEDLEKLNKYDLEQVKLLNEIKGLLIKNFM
ncbi:hypothetical protein BGI41_07855 [Methanobrevibacter sp. 87.7]|uniref:hypothetical protein n=1 Tax=Methanobrevibacter sp. 87.7 TaxID=387957 RepID=UPI000B512F60|nr:hypothetical protein [Methanobrevibacter sp. 87.7]OWT32402.1 hypothetical protein BGI41_07855 [Methanobrevibacter sp. 87.7]